MATEKLIVELDAKTAKLDTKLRATDERLDKLTESTKKTDSALFNMSKASAGVAKGLGVVTVAAGAAITAMTGLSKVVGDYAREIRVASDLSGVAAEKLQIMAHATSTVGIGIEDLGDKFKDTREKIGDFLNTGGGGFQDFVDAMKLTKAEAKELAAEFSVLSGDEILQQMVTRMEEADVSAVQMSHALEGMASDTTKLIPLLKNGGEEMQRLSDRMSSVVVPLTDDDIDLFIRMGTSTDVASAALKNLAESVLLDLGESFIKASEKATFFYASLNKGTEAQKTTRLVEIKDELDELRSLIDSADGAWWNTDAFNDDVRTGSQEKINALLKERLAIYDELAESSGLTAGGKDDKDDVSDLGKVAPNADENEKALNALLDRFKSEEDLLTEKYEKELLLAADNKDLMLQLESEYNEKLAALNVNNSIDAIEDRFKSEEQLLREKLELELEIVGENNELKEELHSEYLENILALDNAAEDKASKLRAKQAKEEKKKADAQDKLDKSLAKSKVDTEKKTADDSIALAELVFEDKKGISSGIALINTAEGVTAALAKYDYVGAALIAVTGAAQISAILSASKGGGSISAGVSSAPPSQSQQADIIDETSSLDFTDSDSSGSSTTTIKFAVDSGDELMDAFANALNKAQSEGRA